MSVLSSAYICLVANMKFGRGVRLAISESTCLYSIRLLLLNEAEDDEL